MARLSATHDRAGRAGVPATGCPRRTGWLARSPVHPGFLAIAVLLLALQAGGPAVAAALRYERAAIAGGELWRLLSGHFVHLGWAHCLLNAGGLLALAAILPAPLRAGRCCLLLGGAIGIALFAALPDLQRYAGFSGINYGLATLALLPRCRGEAVAALLLAALVARAAWQWLADGGAADAAWLGAPPLAAAHFAGLAGGAVLALAGPLRRAALR
ncbi:rhombosortase [Cupriavidus sp. USMAA2-4]|uniref:rhombosortase n=1 Tax=Cupriavidus sp. USMAA2-4 TaxID=876364 RepID=UPI000ABB7A09|nr:rhombosortase [Cupriavidus sp. USMAA2-4]